MYCYVVYYIEIHRWARAPHCDGIAALIITKLIGAPQLFKIHNQFCFLSGTQLQLVWRYRLPAIEYVSVQVCPDAIVLLDLS